MKQPIGRLCIVTAAAHGVVGGGIHYPTLFPCLMNAFLAGDKKTASHRQKHILMLGGNIFSVSGMPCSNFATIKAGLASLRLCERPMPSRPENYSRGVREIIGSILNPPVAA